MKMIRRAWRFVIVLTVSVVALAGNVFFGMSAHAACTMLPSDKGQAVFTVNLPTTGSYRVWSRIYSPSTNNNSFYMQVDQTYCQIIVGNSNTIPVGQFTWVNYKNAQPSDLITLNLSAGNHTVVIAGLDPGVGVDRIIFLSDLTCVPSGVGDNCSSDTATVPTSVVIVGATEPNAAVSGTIALSTLAGVDSTQTVEYLVDGQPITGNNLDTTTLVNGEHTVTAKTTNSDGTVSLLATTITVNNDLSFGQWINKGLSDNRQLIVIVLTSLIVMGMIVRISYRWYHSRLHIDKRHRSSSPVIPVGSVNHIDYFDNSNPKEKKSKL